MKAESATSGRNGHAFPCPGCADLFVTMRRNVTEQELLITIRRGSTARPHQDECVLGLVLRELATQMIP